MAMKEDVIEIDIFSDGGIKVETPSISGANHTSADKLLLVMEKEIGKVTKISDKRKKPLIDNPAVVSEKVRQ